MNAQQKRASEWNPFFGLEYLGGIVVTATGSIKSRAERAHQSYLEGKGGGLGPELILGIGPRGGFRAGLSLDF